MNERPSDTDAPRVLVIGVTTDFLFPVYQQQELAELLGETGRDVEYVELDCIQGFCTRDPCDGVTCAGDLFCFDLVESGRKNFVSKAYVHHVGERGTGSQDDLLHAGLSYLVENRRDFIEAKRLHPLVEQVLGTSVLTGVDA